MPDPVPAPEVSPTGQPLVPPGVVRWLLPIYLVASTSGLGLMMSLDVSPKALAVASALVSAIGALLGMASPGLRRVGPMLVLLGLSLSLSACPRPGPRPSPTSIVVDCARDAIQAQLPGMLVEVDRILSGGTVDWVARLDELYQAAGDVVICAVRKVIANYASSESYSDPQYRGAYGVSPREAAARGQSWLDGAPRP